MFSHAILSYKILALTLINQLDLIVYSLLNQSPSIANRRFIYYLTTNLHELTNLYIRMYHHWIVNAQLSIFFY
jgi:hypothetical protein